MNRSGMRFPNKLGLIYEIWGKLHYQFLALVVKENQDAVTLMLAVFEFCFACI